VRAGSTDTFIFAFDEAVDITGGTPSLTLNDGGAASQHELFAGRRPSRTSAQNRYLWSYGNSP
jgi:hypothetical protein